MRSTDWAGERLPEMLWAAMIGAAFGRDIALDRFRRVAKVIDRRCHADESRKLILREVTFSGLASWADDEFAEFAEAAVGDTPEIFSALLQFDELPGKERWTTLIPKTSPSFDLLKVAVGQTLWHQSQEATDCRWMRVLAALLSGSLLYPREAEELVTEILEYPNYGDQRGVRPHIRATEGSFDGLRALEQGGKWSSSSWSPEFWKQAFELTRADHVRFGGTASSTVAVLTVGAVQGIRDDLRIHAERTTLSTSVSARHEATFGLAAYALDLLLELLSVGNASKIIGRIAIRCLAELTINFTSLAETDDPVRWQRFRDYGYGQAKLAYLKLLESETLPTFISVDALEGLANEDVWHEFREMHIGNWDESDLRKMSEATGLKADVYDKFYDWGSAFTHGNWAALRDAEYDLCLNPLHRLHRVLSMVPKAMPDVIGDAVDLVNRSLVLVDKMYPGFASRVKANTVNIAQP